MTVHLSFLILKGKVIDNYDKTLSNWKHKDVNWNDVYKLMSSSKIQYSCYTWRNGFKTPKNFSQELQDCIILDVDDGKSIHSFQKEFGEYKYCLATTKSHQKDKKGLICDRYRVIFPAINVSKEPNIYFRSLELFCKDNDEQTLTSTASFLGNTEAIVIYNDGDVVDMFPYNELAEMQLEEERIERVVIDKDLLPTYNSNSLEAVKEQLNFEVVRDVLSSLGYEIIGNKFSLRDERTKSVKIYNDGYYRDFGSGEHGDIFKILMDYHDMKFRESIDYVSNFL